ASAVAVLVAAAGTTFAFRTTMRSPSTPAPIEQDAAIATVAALLERATPRAEVGGLAGFGRPASSPGAADAPTVAAAGATARPAGRDARGGVPQRVDHLHADAGRGRSCHAGARPARRGRDGGNRERRRRPAALRSSRLPAGRRSRHQLPAAAPGSRWAGGRPD